MPRKTFVAGEVLLAQDVNQFLMDQSVMNFASSAARSSAIPTPTEGMFAVTTDNDQVDYYNGSDWVPALPVGAWQSWAPTLSGGWENGNGTWVARYVQIGKTVHYQAFFTIGSETTKGTILNYSLPIIANSSTASTQVGFRTNVNATFVSYLVSTTTASVLCLTVSGTNVVRTNIAATVPLTWATGNQLYFSGTYEAA
jgi:hypothetical protein